MSTDPIVTVSPIKGKYFPFDRSIIADDLSGLESRISQIKMASVIKDRGYISYEFSGAEFADGSTATARGFRATSFGPGFAQSTSPSNGWVSGGDFRWLNFITGKVGGMTLGTPTNPSFNVHGDSSLETASIRDWYLWGARKFWLHHPFGRVAKGRNNQEAMHYQPDAYYSAKHGCTCPFTGILGNRPMPWLTDDVVDGVTQGFVPLFKALITGSQGDLSNDVWQRLTGIGGGEEWYNPADPIEVVVYNGTINNETFRKWRRWFETSTPIANAPFFGATGETEGMPANLYARYRLEASLEPFKRAGMRVAFDALVAAPGPINGLNACPTSGFMPTTAYEGQLYTPAGQSYGAADVGWWKFFSEYVLGNWQKKDIFMEAHPDTIPGINQVGFTMNPYQKIGGLNICASDEYTRRGFGGTSASPPFAPTNSRAHYLGEYGAVEFVRSPGWSSLPHVGKFVGGNTFYDGHYWFLRGLEEQTAVIGSLPDINFGAGNRYLRAKETFPTGVYQGACIWGSHLYADHFIRYQEQENCQTTIAQDLTSPGVLILSHTLRRIDDGNMTTIRNQTGITNDFNRAYPTLTDYAKFVADRYSFYRGMGVTAFNDHGISFPSYITNISNIIDRTGTAAALNERLEGLSHVLYLDPTEYDTFAGTGLQGRKNGGFYIPTPANDLQDSIFQSWLDTKIKSWHRTFGKYPKYICWLISEYSGKADNTLNQLEMERYLFFANTIPLSTTETSSAYSNKEQYFSRTPRVDLLSIPGTETLANVGFCGTPGCGNAGGALSSAWTEVRDILVSMLQKTKDWRTIRGLDAKIGLYRFPYLPEEAYAVYGLSGTNAVKLTSAGWNARVFPKQDFTLTNGRLLGGQAGWHTEAETESLKSRIRLEYRKRLEPIVKECEFLSPDISCKTPNDMASDPNLPMLKEWGKEVINLASNMKTIGAWNPQTGFLGDGSLPALTGGRIIPAIEIGYRGTPVSGITVGDPLTIADGSLFDYDKMDYTLVDWIRDDYLRPVRGVSRKVDGISLKKRYFDRALGAMRGNASTYSGRTADRDWVLKWLQASDGSGLSGATVAWTNSTDVGTKMNRFFDIQRSVSKNLLYRFDYGQPRIDIVSDPFKHTVFAVGWNAGYNGSYPATLDGMAITDVHPLIWVGWTAGTNGFIRDPGDTAGPATNLFNETISRMNKVPRGRRVLLPYYWHQDPISDQTLRVNHYAQTNDGATYTGTLPLRTHELPGPVKLITPWAYQQTSDAKQSFQAFLNQCIATGAVFDYIADDGESWTNITVGSNSNFFFAPFGPTGMPARLEATGGTNHVFAFASWLKEPDNRMVPTYMKDPRVNTLVNPYTGLSFGAAVANKYKELLSNSTFFQNNGTLIDSFDARAALGTIGSSAAFVMDYFTREGATGISAATGPASVTQLAPPIGTNTEYINNDARNATNPWRNPWGARTDTTPNGRVSRYAAWLANRSAVEDLVMGDLYKRMWIDTIRGSTSENHRKTKYGHYDVYPVGVTEGAFLMDYSGHTPIHSDFSHIAATPVLYGEVGGDLRRAKYSTQPTDDYFKHSFILSFHHHPEGTIPFNDTAKTAFFTDQAGDIPARSYIALAKEVAILRGMLRTNPNSWKNLSPWIWNPFDLWWIGMETPSFRADRQSPTVPVFDRCDITYWNELLYHCLLSGTEHFNYFNPGANIIDATPSKVPGEIGEGGFTAGLTFMQGVLNEWKTISEGYRVQPCSNASGNPSALVDRLDISAAGGNHTGATGTVVSGAVILKNNSGKISDTILGGTDDKTYVWRISAAPQGTNLFLQGGFTAELPKQINLVTGELSYGMTAAMSGATSGGFSEFAIKGGTLSYSSGTHTNLSTLLGIPDSGADLHHTSQTIPSNNLTQPFVLGDGRRTTLTFNGRQTSTVVPFDPQIFNVPPVAGSRGGLTIVGFFDLTKANGLHGTNGNLLGIETAVAFVSFGGSVWQTVVTFKNPTTGQYRTYRKVLIEQVGGVFINGSFVDRTLKIDVNEDGSEAQFFVDGRLVDTVNSASIASDGAALGGMPVGQFRGNGTWAGAGVRDISLSETATTATSIQTLLCNSLSTSILPKTTDAQVTVSRRGAWIKSRRSPLMPQYKISDLNAPLPEGHLRNGGGFPTTNPDEIFSGDPAPIADTSDLTVTGDLRAIAAWKEDPIPFYQTPPSGTVTVMAFHPSGIQKVEASLNGGQIATRTGTEGIPYQEFTFILPPLSGGSGPFVNLPKTPAGVSYGGMHQIRAKVFPFSGKPRVLGGLPEESSQYYSPIAPGDPTPKKRETNETSFFLMNVANTDSKLTRFCTVNPTFTDNFPTLSEPLYKSIREAVMWELGSGSGLCGSAKNKDFLIIKTIASGIGGNAAVFPCVGDDDDLGGVPSRLQVTYLNPENKTLIINEIDDSATTGVTLLPNTVSGSDNSATSFRGLAVGSIADTWTNTTQIFGSVLPSTAKAYGLSSDGFIYRLNKNPLAIYNGSTTTAPSLSNPNWAFGGTASLWESARQAARAGGFAGIGRVKLNGLPNARYIIDRAKCPNFFTTDSTQAIRFENVQFTSTMLPSVDPKDFVRNGNASYVNCVINAITGGLQHGFGYSRYVSGCTAVGVRGTVFSNAALVMDSVATGSSKLDKTNPSFLGRFVESGTNIKGDALVKKNSIYQNISCTGDFADCISMGRNEATPLAADKHKIGHYDLLYRNIQMGGTVGIADRIEGNVNNVHFVGVSMPNAMILSPEYKSALTSGSLKKQKFYVDAGSRMRMVMNEGPTSGNQIALQGDDFTQNYRTGFGIQMGDPLSPSNDAIVSIKPKRPGGIGVKIKGIPTKYDVLGALSSGSAPGNTWTPIFTKTHLTTGIKTFGLEMGGGFGPTAQGFTANGLTFACWSRNSFDAVPLSPRLCWVYSTNVFWPAVTGVTASSWVPNDRYTYEFGVSGIAQPTIAPFVSANLHTFFNSNSMSDSVLPDRNASIHWMMLRNRTEVTDTWSNTPYSQDIAASPTNVNFAAGVSAHWLMNGQDINLNTAWMGTSRNFDIIGTGGTPQGRIQIARTNSNAEATALAVALNSNSKPALGGITITDQFGNLFRIDGGVGAFTTSTVLVLVNGDQIKYASGSVVGTPWTAAGVIGAFPREWIYNGDATTQYAPIKLEINLNNTAVRGSITA